MGKQTLTGRPPTERGRRKRGVLVQAAREVFEESGFEETRIAQITGRAGIAYGSFYTYFDSKDAIFHEVAKGVAGEMFDAARSAAPPGTAPVDRIRHATGRFLSAYRDNARIMQVIEQISPRHPVFRTLFLEIRGLFVDRIISGTRRLQEEGLASADIDVEATASMLGGMVEHTARMLFLYGESHDPEVVVETATRLWARGIGLEYEPPGASGAQPLGDP
ncbi:TetR/AcrR family transcriptional regulator [Nocardiopsis exhalans]|uniref:TetR/AcrR family transcriptional regulator n=1 Tax=Nocardiopsis exhalans TaxID=163604 RepID=A0ABY5DA83_9ACTN|nr:TetR/AcrR family transcriptional regulator [Nocardiopsis exhalans]USY20850.1 TetR/AcrR family transcriptional regulator [Nocardiopsis exhalans]